MVSGAVVSQDVINAIREAILEEAGGLGVGVDRIILFGSRARGDFRDDSDYDILVVVKGKLDWRVKKELYGRIQRRLVGELRAPVDVVIVSLDYWRKYKDSPGTILYPAAKEGIAIA